MEVLREKRKEREKQEQKNEEEVRRLHSRYRSGHVFRRYAMFLTFQPLAIHPELIPSAEITSYKRVCHYLCGSSWPFSHNPDRRRANLHPSCQD